ncbi:hypothetical protein BV20DRAFT_1037123 [Pilatotrama ljubarskyi]|nr:hypothetical protein BV20DRAFT_1038505 [Pilatotrama ljubarskyi]KAI0368483.1 hypothetical protein BV20DRAFT_1037123 [Pilatotrama ljubarskyi]
MSMLNIPAMSVGVRVPSSCTATHYILLDCSQHLDVQRSEDATPVYDSSNLLLCSHDNFLQQACKVQFADSEVQSEWLVKGYGIKNIPVLSVCENVIKNLMNLWSGHYKGLNEGSEGLWPLNMASNKMSWMAELRSLWTLYVAPIVLCGRLSRLEYYEHFIELIRLVKFCLQFKLTAEEIASIESGFVKWVRDYKE